MKIDRERKEITLSVRDLLYEDSLSLRREGVGFERMTLGRMAHQLHQGREMEKNHLYRKEFFVKHKLHIEGYKITIQGRIDGIIEDDEKIIIEEIKSVPFSSEEFSRISESTIQQYGMQLKIYCYLVKKGLGKGVRAYLVLFSLIDSAEKRIELHFHEEEISEFIELRMKEIIKGVESEFERDSIKKGLADKLRFPFPDVRMYQDKMINAISHALEDGKDILISAPAGIGKTAGALYPVLLYALRNSKKIFFITSKTTQQSIVIETLKRFQSKDVKVNAILLRAKEKVCLNELYFCDEQFCPYIQDFYYKKEAYNLTERLWGKGIIEPASFIKAGDKFKICPFELSLALAQDADVIVCDYNYIFDPEVYLRRFFDRADEYILIIDEAHNLYYRGMDYYSPSLESNELQSLINFLKGKRIKVFKQFLKLFQSINAYLNETIKDCEGKTLTEIDKGFFSDAKERFDELILKYFIYRKERDLFRADDAIDTFYRNFARFFNVLSLEGDEFSYISDKENKRLKILCKDPSVQLAKRMKGFHRVIAMSATLEPLPFYRDVLGFSEDAITLTLPSPFPEENRRILVIPTVSTRYEERERNYNKIAEIIEDIVTMRRKNWLVFFPSFKFLREVKKCMSSSLSIISQEESMSDDERDELLKNLMTEQNTIFAVQGGIFGEGIDYSGEMATGVIIVGPALPLYCFEQELVREHYQRKLGKGFEYAYLYPGMNRVIQSAGRIIRSENDKGIIVLIGRRFATPRYYSTFPRYWYKNSPKEIITLDYRREVEMFFEVTK